MYKLPITAIILCGGRGIRMNNQDKGLILFKGQPLFEHLIERLSPQVQHIMINANRHQTTYQLSGYPVFSDVISGYLGPLAGIYSGLYYATTDWCLFVSCDTPFIPENLVIKLYHSLDNYGAAYVSDGKRNHPTLLMIHKKLMQPLKSYIESGERKLQLFLKQHQARKVDFSESPHSFININ
ncbi:MAG: molybdenum cofactor guanylyltransferase MobA, partial [Candidatus Schmidhempelia sp.]|nr:molybdenum cofactor guanylyltransferase MobA [Candidatus Schmidhempelia sp.]